MFVEFKNALPKAENSTILLNIDNVITYLPHREMRPLFEDSDEEVEFEGTHIFEVGDYESPWFVKETFEKVTEILKQSGCKFYMIKDRPVAVTAG